MIVATPQGDVEHRDLFAGTDRIPRPSEIGGMWSEAGRRVTVADVVGLPAFMMGVRLLSETLASLPLVIYEGDVLDKQVARDAPQTELLQVKPNAEMFPFGLWAYVTACRQGWQGAYLLKTFSLARRDRTILELNPLEPQRVTPRVQNSQLVFDVVVEDGQRTETLSRADVIYIPAVLFDHPLIGVSPVTAHRQALGGALGLQEFGNRFFANDATPGLVITADAQTTKPQRVEARESWNAQSRGAGKAHSARVLPNGFTVEKIGVSPQDAQYIEGQQWTVEQCARVLKLPGWILGGKDQAPRLTPEQRNQEVLQFHFASHFAMTEQALHADDDLFPDKTLRPAFLAEGMLRADTAARYAAYTQARQAGWLSVNDIRRKEGEAPIEGGDVYQTTPVGGAPNLQPGQETSPAGEPDDGVQEPANPVT